MPTPPTPILTTSSRVLAASDIANCGDSGDEKTAALLGDEPEASILTMGDNVSRSGTHQQCADCFDPSWSQYKNHMYPAPGNHDYYTENAAGYFDDFGAAAGAPTEGYYSVSIGSWQIISLQRN
jgi:hypothetical protein